MSDFADDSEQYVDLMLKEALSRIKPESLPECGACYFCQSLLSRGHRFCSNDCLSDFESEQRLKRIAGKK